MTDFCQGGARVTHACAAGSYFERWARELTAEARERERILRDEAIQAGKAEGKSVRQIAGDAGVGVATVDRVLNGIPKGKTSKSEQPIEPDADYTIRNDPRQLDIEDVRQVAPEPTAAEIARANLSRMEAPEVQGWHAALEALRRVNAQPTKACGHALSSLAAQPAARSASGPCEAPGWRR